METTEQQIEELIAKVAELEKQVNDAKSLNDYYSKQNSELKNKIDAVKALAIAL